MIVEDDISYYLTTFVPGASAPNTADTLELLGRLLGRLHSLPVEASGREIQPTWFSLEGCSSGHALAIRDPRIRHVAYLDDLSELAESAWSRIEAFDEEPACVVHTDPTIANVVGIVPNSTSTLSRDTPHTPEAAESSITDVESARLTLVDWDDSGLGQGHLDVGMLLVSICVEAMSVDAGVKYRPEAVTWHPRLARAVIRGYADSRPIESLKHRLVDAMLFGCLVYLIQPWRGQIAWPDWQKVLFLMNCRDAVQADLLRDLS